jgi:hypothetical protein
MVLRGDAIGVARWITSENLCSFGGYLYPQVVARSTSREPGPLSRLFIVPVCFDYITQAKGRNLKVAATACGCLLFQIFINQNTKTANCRTIDFCRVSLYCSL